MTEVSNEFVKAAGFIYQQIKVQNLKRSSKFSPRKFTVAQIRALIAIALIHRFDRQSPHFLAPKSAPSVVQERYHRATEPIRSAGPMSYRRLVEMLHKSQSLRDTLELQNVPDHSTLSKAWSNLK